MPLTIDLGPTFDGDVNDGVHTGAPRRTPIWMRRARFRFGVPLIAIVALLSASAPAPAAPLVKVARIQFGDSATLLVHRAIAGDYLFTLGTVRGQYSLRSYSLAGGGLRWTVPVAEPPTGATMVTSGSTLLVSVSAEQSPERIHTEAFDTESGRRLWDSLDTVFAVADNGDVYLESRITYPMAGVANTPSAPPGWLFRRVAARTGGSFWSIGIRLDCDQELVHDPENGMPDGLFLLCSEAPELRVIDLATGWLRAERHISTGGDVPLFPPPPMYGPMAPQAIVLGDVIVVAHAKDSAATIDGFRAADLTPIWTGFQVAPWQETTACRPDLCLLSASGNRVINPHTGRVIPNATPSSVEVVPLSRFALARVVPVAGVGPDHYGDAYLGRPGSGQGATRRGAANKADAGGKSGTPRTVLDADVSAYSSAVARMAAIGDGVVADVPIPAVGDAWLVRLGAGEDAVPIPVARLSGVGASACMQISRYLACATAFSDVTFWRLP